MSRTAEYVWLDASGNFRSKSKTIKYYQNPLKDPAGIWDYDGSSTGQAQGSSSEVKLVPVRTCPDPFRVSDRSPGEENILVLCKTETDSGPLPGCHRDRAEDVFLKYKDSHPWYGLEQEYFLLKPDGSLLNSSEEEKVDYHYCGVGKVYGRDVAERHYMMMLKANLTVSGINAEVAPGQWEFQIGPVEGIDAADQLLLARYILVRCAEKYDLLVSFAPKVRPQYNGSGCHHNFSTENMRNGRRSYNGYFYVSTAIDKLSERHVEYMKEYGSGNKERMTGIHETSSFDRFTRGVADRGASVRVPRKTANSGYGYFEDRRPAANCDPYVTTSLLLDACHD